MSSWKAPCSTCFSVSFSRACLAERGAISTVSTMVWSCLGAGRVGGVRPAGRLPRVPVHPSCLSSLHWGTRFQAAKRGFFRARQTQRPGLALPPPPAASGSLSVRGGSSPCPPLPEGLMTHTQRRGSKDAKGTGQIAWLQSWLFILNFFFFFLPNHMEIEPGPWQRKPES